jgi:hypothetical protein
VANGLPESQEDHRPKDVVPLEAGLGPSNPPCPACGEPLFGWTTARDEPVRRCEACGLAVIGEPGERGDVLAELEHHRVQGGDDLRYRMPNRASFQAWLGGGAWAPIASGTTYLFTREAVRRLVSDRDQVLSGSSWRPGAGVATMWATLVNTFTFGRNTGLAAFGRGVAEPAAKPWQRRLDAFINVVTAPVVLPVALVFEAIAAVAGRGGAMELRLRLE